MLNFCTSVGRPALVAILDTNPIEATPEALKVYATDFLLHIIPALHEEEILDSEQPAQVIGHSMGGGALGLAVGEAPELFGPIVLAQSIRMDTIARINEKPNEVRRRREFSRDFMRVVFGLYSETSLTARLHAAHDLLGQLAADAISRDTKHIPTLKHGFKQKAILSTNESILPAILNHAVNNNVIVFTGRKDPLVRTKQVMKSILIYVSSDAHEHTEEELKMIAGNIDFPTPPIKHSYMGWDTNKQMMSQIFRFLKTRS